MTQRRLIVDDEPAVCEVIAYNLERHGFGARTARHGLSALAMARREQPDLVVLDLMLPGMHGHDVCRELRTFSAVPIIILTAQGGDEADRVIGPKLGARPVRAKTGRPRWPARRNACQSIVA
jgi:DNA-binding response OmpR family regulator